MRATLPLSVALLLLPGVASANGGSSGVGSRTSNAMAGAHPGPLGETALVQEDDVECRSESLVITLNADHVAVQVDYLFFNHGPSKTLWYAFPFALGEQDALVDGVLSNTRQFGEPTSYALSVDGKPAASETRAGAPVPREIPVPRIEDNTDAPEGGMPGEEPGPTRILVPRYRWSYRVSAVEFPSSAERRLRVNYAVPYLVYEKKSELGAATSPGQFSYLLSTGGHWRGGTIGHLDVTVTSSVLPIGQIQIDGLPFKRERTGWHFEANQLKPTTEANLVVRRSEFARLQLEAGTPLEAAKGMPRDVLGDRPTTAKGAWTSPPVGGPAPVRVELGVGERIDASSDGVGDDAPGRRSPWGWRWQGNGRYRLRLALAEGKEMARLTRARVELTFGKREPEVFHATFKEADPRDVASSGGYRAIWFDAPETPATITIIPLEVVPGARGERRLRFTGIKLEQDVSNYDAYVQRPR